MDPKVSVIIPTYNREKLLPRAIQSVLNQTYSNWELIVVDDGSTDNTKKIVEEFQKKDRRIEYIWQENFGGTSKPINTGLKVSQGEYIALLEDDDEWLPEKLERQLEVFQNSKKENLGFVSCSVLIVNDKTKAIKTCNIPEHSDKIFSEKPFHNQFFFNFSTLMITREVINKVGFLDENLKFAAGGDFGLRIFNKYNFDFVPTPLVKCHIHRKNATRMPFYDRILSDLLYMHRKHRDLYKKYPKVYSCDQRSIGNLYILLGDCRRGRKYFLRSIATYPFNFKSYQNLLLSFLGSRAFMHLFHFKKKILSIFSIFYIS